MQTTGLGLGAGERPRRLKRLFPCNLGYTMNLSAKRGQGTEVSRRGEKGRVVGCEEWFTPTCQHLRDFAVVQLLSCVQLFVTPWTAAYQASLFIADSWSLLKLLSMESVMPSNLCHPLLLLPSIFPSIRVFSNESAIRIWWPKYWSFSFSLSPSNEYSGLISFRIDWFDLLAVQGTLQSLL